MYLDFDYSIESLNKDIKICITDDHKFGTDAFLLGNFANPKHKDIVCDLGTGCGIIPFYMAKAFNPKYIYAVDIMEKAIKQLEHSLSISNIKTTIKPINIDLKMIQEQIPASTCNIITCNPPFKMEGAGILSTSETDKVARHETMCTIDDICKVSNRLLQFGGKLCICQRPERLPDVIMAMRNHGIEPKRLRFVQKNPGSAPWLFLIEGRKKGNPFMQVEAPLYIQGENGFSEELTKIYSKEDIL